MFVLRKDPIYGKTWKNSFYFRQQLHNVERRAYSGTIITWGSVNCSFYKALSWWWGLILRIKYKSIDTFSYKKIIKTLNCRLKNYHFTDIVYIFTLNSLLDIMSVTWFKEIFSYLKHELPSTKWCDKMAHIRSRKNS